MTSSYPEIHIHVKRHLMESLPNDTHELEAWLHQRFVEKDRWVRATVIPPSH